jgi:hypothetical protein
VVESLGEEGLHYDFTEGFESGLTTLVNGFTATWT